MGAVSKVEIERKYDVDAATALPDLGSVAPVAASGVAMLRAVYYDTPGRELAARRLTLRRRTGGDDEGWHLKTPEGGGRREHVAPLADEVPQELLDELRRQGVTGDPAPVVRLHSRRRWVRLAGDGGEPAAEIADDLVSATDLTTGIMRGWREWEAELLDGAPEDPAGQQELLDRIEAALRDAGAEPSASASKLARAMGLAGLGGS